MIAILRRLLWDEAYATQFLRAATMLLGQLLVSGVITLDRLGDQFGPVGWYLGLILSACSVFVRAGDKQTNGKE
jgi:hypothetical protein